MYKNVIFDLDGTIIQSHPGIINAVRYALERLKLPMPSEEVIFSRIGPPLGETFLFLGVKKGEENNAVSIYREYYNEIGIYECNVYDGIPEQLEKLKSSGKTLLVATSKPRVFAKRILEKYAIADYFDYIDGSNLDNTMTDKAALIIHALNQVGEKPDSSAVMVGDTKYDILGAKQAGIPSAGVLYGYGTKEDLIKHGAVIIIPKTEDIYNCICE